jgi:5-methyltetrahydropteroyltriglutamate--homocysteine methyltransferase
MPIPTEPIGSIPRPLELIEAVRRFAEGRISQAEMDAFYESALRDTIARVEATGSPVITDGEQTKPSFATYPIHGLDNIAPDGVIIPFADGHQRQLPRLTAGPFRYKFYAESYLKEAQSYAHAPVKQAVISPSALSLLYPAEGIDAYPREVFINDLITETETDIRRCLNSGAHNVQIDFTEGRLSIKLDPTRQLLKSFIDLNNRVLDRFSAEERKRIGVHTCPGGDQDSTHSADVKYSDLLPSLFELKVGRFYIQLASESDPVEVLQLIKEYAQLHQMIFVGVIDPINPKVETSEEVRDRVLEAAEYIPLSQLGSTDDCGFSPFGDDLSTSREAAFEKIRARVVGTQMASQKLEA